MRSEIKIITTVVFSIIALLTLFLSINIVPEGKVGVVTQFSEYSRNMEPGLHFKVPFVERVREFNVRQTLNKAAGLEIATKNKLYLGMDVSYNWRMKESGVDEIFINYGTPNTFIENIIFPQVEQIVKETTGQYTADEMINKRKEVAAEMAESLRVALVDYPIAIGNVFIENIALNEKYRESILEKERAREDRDRAKFEVQKQEIEQEKLRNTAKAEGDAILIIAKAQADAIALVNAQITPEYTNYKTIEKWDGVMPGFLSGDAGNLGIIIDSAKAGIGGSPKAPK